VAFIDRGDVKVVGADGLGERVLAAHADAPAWSPDGRHVAVIDARVVQANGLLHLTLEVLSAEGSGRHTVFDAGPTLGVLGPQWSPNGGQLAVVVIVTGNPF
jgi:Tol biopolymer transport system component